MNTVVETNFTVEQVTELALKLTPDQQALLVARLHDNLESFDRSDEHDPAWAEELDRRLGQIKNGEAELIDHEVAMKRLRERFRG
jgi:putative addiction module component (TIGR02574 family)